MGFEAILQGKISHEDIKRLREHLENRVWSEARANWIRWESFENNDFAVWPTRFKSRPISRPSTPSFIVARAVDTQMAFHPSVHRRRSRDTAAGRIQADSVEPWLREALSRAMRKEMLHSGRQAAHYLVALGYSVLFGPIPDWKNYIFPPERKDSPNNTEGEKAHEQAVKLWEAGQEDWSPFTLRAPHPSTVLLDPGERRPSFGMIVHTMFAGDILYRVNQRKGRKATRLSQTAAFEPRDNPFQEIEVLEFWSLREHWLITEDEGVIVKERNPFGFVPFIQSFSGWGSARSGDQGNPANLAIGILSRIEDGLRREAQEVSGKHNMVTNMSFPPIVAPGNASDLARQLAEGGILEGWTKEDIGFMQFPNITGDIFRFGEETGRDIEKGSYNQIASGFREVGVRTLGEQEILSRATNLKFEAPREGMNDMFSVVASNMLRLTTWFMENKIARRIKIAGHEIGAKEIGDRYSVDVDFKVVDPQLVLQEKQNFLVEFQAGLRDKKSYWEASGYENATEIDRGLAEDQFDQHPAVQANRLAEVARLRGMPDIEAGFNALRDRMLEQTEAEVEAFNNGQEVGGNGAGPAGS